LLNFPLFHLKTTIFAVVLSIRLLMPSQIQNIFKFDIFKPIRIWALTIFLFFTQVVKSQDPIYSQYYNAHLQLNSALAGNTNGPLFQLNYRNQWPLLDKIYTTYSVSYDQFVRRLNSGVGVQLLTDNAGDGTLRTTGLTGYYSYKLRVKKKSFIKGGMEIGYSHLGLDWSKLIFGDAIDPGSGHISPGGTPFPSKEQNLENTSKNLAKHRGLALSFFNPEYYVGVSLKNLNTPDISFLESGTQSRANRPNLCRSDFLYMAECKFI
jgi:type IX secretion system PorP/SprF family membrane protein